MEQSLGTLPVLFLDCQTTGSTPDTGHLLEIGWCVGCAADVDRNGVTPDRITSRLVALPPGAELSRQIARLTGIAGTDLEAGIDRRELWPTLGEDAAAVATDDTARALAIAHYARFEEQFLRRLHVECAGGAVDGGEPDAGGPCGDTFPLRFICTHEIARRLFPSLPRRGLRPLAGYFGFSLPEPRRVTPHVQATMTIWAGLVRLLAAERGIRTLEALFPLLESRAPARGSRWSYPLPREKRLAVDPRPGVYRFLGGDGRVLYVGKATSLKSRVNSYYRQRRAGDKVLELVSQAHDLEVTVTVTSLEAALLENEEIKRLAPPYNRALRDDGRDVWYVSRDLRRASPEPDIEHPCGPVPASETMRGVGELVGLLEQDARLLDVGRDTAVRLAVGFGLESRWIDPEVWREGLRLFAAKHAGGLGAPPRPIALLTLGTRLWRERRAEAEAAAGEEQDVGVDSPENEVLDLLDIFAERAAEVERGRGGHTGLDAGAVVEYFEEAVIHAAHMMRRARWFALLADAIVSWDSRAEHRRLVLRRGEIRDGADRPPSPGRHRVPRIARLDRTAYDRLRVLTTELRRLVTQEREVELLLPTGQRLSGMSLRRLMRMV